MDEKTLMALGTLGGIIAILPIVAWFAGGSNLQGNNRETLATMANLEICLFVVGVILMFIPVVGQILSAVVGVINIVIAIKAYTCIDKTAFKLSVPEILK